MWIYTGKKVTKFRVNILSLSENIAKSFRGGGYFCVGDSNYTVRSTFSNSVMR